MPHKDPAKHSKYVKQWLFDPEHPERLEHKRQRERERYQQNRDKRRAQVSEYYKNNKELVKAREARYRAESAVIIAEARDVPCADCGHKFPPICMQFHHLDPSTKTGDVRSMGHPTRVKREIEKCIVICANCHCIRHGEENA